MTVVGSGATDLDVLAGRVDAAVAALADLDPAAQAAAEELKSALEDIHRAGLTTIVARMRADDAARPLLFDLVDDPVVRMLLSLHGIIRPDPVTLAERALSGVRPQLHSHGGDVTLVRIVDRVAFVELHGACNGCSMAAVTLRELVETALLQGVSSLSAVEVVADRPSPTLIPVEALRMPPRPHADGWVDVGRVDELAVDALTVCDHGVIVVSLGQRLSAYRNECAHEALPLDEAIIDTTAGTLTCPWHGFCFDAASGECLSAPGVQLEQLPLRIDDGDVWVRTGR